jgi:hypothetical protein
MGQSIYDFETSQALRFLVHEKKNINFIDCIQVG